MDIQIIKELLRKFNTTKECQYLKKIYEQKSFMEILSVNRTEMQHSAFISWLLEGKDFDCNDQDFPMMHFLDLLLTRAFDEGEDFPTNFSNSDVLERCILERDIPSERIDGTIIYIKDDPTNYSQRCENLVKFINRDSNCLDRIKVYPFVAKF